MSFAPVLSRLLTRCCFFWLLASGSVAARETLHIDLAHHLGPIRALHGANFGPLCANGLVDLTSHHRQLHLPSTRLHDIPWTYGEVVDIHTLFRNPKADPASPASYDFRRTDDYLIATTNTHSPILFRLGESIEHTPQKYWVHPPADFDAWASVCLQVVRHYNEGWAHGFRHGIRDWEIWNEPENQPACWTGSNDAYFQLYALTSRKLKEAYPTLRVGGPAVGNSGEVIEGNFKPSAFVSQFLAHCQKHQLPLDFFSWHIYTDDPKDMLVRARGLRTLLDTHGFRATQLYLDEWNYLPGKDWSPFSKRNQGAPRDRFFEVAGGAEAAAFVAAFLIRLQDSPVDLAHFFSADNQGFGLFTANGAPRKTFHAFRALGELSQLPHRLAIHGALTNQVEALAGADPQRGIASTILVNRSPKPLPLSVTWQNLPARSRIQCITSLLDATSDFTVQSSNPLQPDQPTTSITLPPASVVRLDLASQ